MKTKQQFSTRVLVKAALLTAVSIVLTRVFSVTVPLGGLPTLRVGIGTIPLILSGMLFGPLVGGLVGALSDVVGYVLNSGGTAYFPGFTLSAALYGVFSGWMIKGLRIHQSKWNFNFLNAIVMLSFALGVLVLLLSTGALAKVDGQWRFEDLAAFPVLIATLLVTVLFIIIPFVFNKWFKDAGAGIAFDKIAFIVSVSYVFNGLFLNTLWLSMLYDKGFLVFLPGRVLGALVTIPVYSWLLYILARFFKSDIQ